MIMPPGASLVLISDQASSTASSGYCRSTLNARTKTGRWPANSKPPMPNSTESFLAVRAALTRSGSISSPITRMSVRTVRSLLANSSVVTGSAP